MKAPQFLLFSILFLILSSCGNSSSNSTSESEKGVVFPNATYTKVVAYHFEDLSGNGIIDDKGQLNPTVKKEKELEPDQIEDFLKLINNEKTYGGEYTRCFKPRLGVVFYNGKNPVAHISICFECSQQVSTPTILAYTNAPNGSFGYSEEGFRALTSFCRQLGFGQCGE